MNNILFVFLFVFVVNCVMAQSPTDVKPAFKYAIVDSRIKESRLLKREQYGKNDTVFISTDALIPIVKSIDFSDFTFMNTAIKELINTKTDYTSILTNGQKVDNNINFKNHFDEQTRDLIYTLIKQSDKLLWLAFDYEKWGDATGIGTVKLSLLIDIEQKKIITLKEIVEPTKISAFEQFVFQQAKIDGKARIAALVEDGMDEMQAKPYGEEFRKRVQNIFLQPIAINNDQFQIYFEYHAPKATNWEPVEIPLSSCVPFFTEWFNQELK